MKEASAPTSPTADNCEGDLVKKKKKKRVVFSTAPESHLEEDPDMSPLLREARIGDFFRRQADRARAERLLGPVFDLTRRRELLEQRLSGGPASVQIVSTNVSEASHHRDVKEEACPESETKSRNQNSNCSWRE